MLFIQTMFLGSNDLFIIMGFFKRENLDTCQFLPTTGVYQVVKK